MTAEAAYWFLPAAIPLAFYIAFNDMRAMRISNGTVLLVLVAYGVLGPFAFGWPMYGWQWLHYPVVLMVCIALWALRVMGGGDAKLIAALSPYMVVGDLEFILRLFPAALLAALVVHRTLKVTALRRLTPHWESWTSPKFPKGFPLGMTWLFYLLMAAIFL